MARGPLKHGYRDHIFGKKFFRSFKKKTGTELTYLQCSDILRKANDIIGEVVRDEYDGFKLPNGMGYLVAIKYIPTKDYVNWYETGKRGVKVIYLNFHTNGYACRVQWFRIGKTKSANLHELYKFKAGVKLGQIVSYAFANGKMYSEFTVRDFLEKGRLENFFSKKYRKELK